MNAKKILSVVVSATIALSSTHSFAATLKGTLRSFENKTTEEIQAEIDGLNTELVTLVNSNVQLDRFLDIATNEGFISDLQRNKDKVVKAAISSAFAMTPIYVAYQVGWSANAISDLKKEIAVHEKIAWEKARLHHKEFLDDLAKTFNTTTPRSMVQLEQEFLQHLEKSSAKYAASSLEAKQILRGLTANLHHQIASAGGDAGKIFLDGVNDSMARHAYNKSYMYEWERKIEEIRKRLGKKRIVAFILAAAGVVAGGAYYKLNDDEIPLSQRDESDLSTLKFWASMGETERIQNFIDDKTMLRAEIGSQILTAQERVVLLETVLMLRGVQE